MQISELKALRDKIHKQFINRCAANDNTIFFYVGAGADSLGENSKALLMKLIDLVSDKLDNALVLADVSLEKGVRVVSGKEEKIFADVTVENVEKTLQAYFG